MRYLILAAAALASACGNKTSGHAVLPTDVKLSSEDQQARLAACQVEAQQFAVAHPDIQVRPNPIAGPSVYYQLPDGEADHLRDIAACLGAAGQVGEREVIFSYAGNEYHRETSPNDRDW